MKQRPRVHLLVCGLAISLFLAAAGAFVFLLSPGSPPGAAIVPAPPPATPAFTPPVLAETPAVEVPVPAATPSPTSPRHSTKGAAPFRPLPPQCSAAALSSIYLDASQRAQAASERLKAVLNADPESREVEAKKISSVADDVSFCALAQMFEDPTLRPLMLDSLRKPENFQANLEFGTVLVEGVAVTFDDTKTPDDQADRFRFAAPLYQARYQRLIAKFDMKQEITSLLPDAIGADRVKRILEEYMGERGWRFDAVRRQFIPNAE